MKTLFLTLIMLSVFTLSNAQLKGVPFDEAIPWDKAQELTLDELYNVLIKAEPDDGTVYSYIYELKSKGYFDALKKLSMILEVNDITRPADFDDSYFESHIDEKDYNKVVFELKLERGWVDRKWVVNDDGWVIGMVADDEAIAVFVGQYN